MSPNSDSNQESSATPNAEHVNSPSEQAPENEARGAPGHHIQIEAAQISIDGGEVASHVGVAAENVSTAAATVGGNRAAVGSSVGTVVTFDLELSSLLRRAGWIGQGAGNQPVVSLASLFLSFFAAPDHCSAWVRRTSELTGLVLADVVQHAHTRGESLDEGRVQLAEKLTDDQLARNWSYKNSAARMLVGKAIGLRTELGAPGSLTALQVLAAYVYDVTGDHAADLDAWVETIIPERGFSIVVSARGCGLYIGNSLQFLNSSLASG